jgi:hypothetical protein
MACEQCKIFLVHGAQNVAFSVFEKQFEIKEIHNYPMACVGKASCKNCKHTVSFDYDEVLLIKLTLTDW